MLLERIWFPQRADRTACLLIDSDFLIFGWVSQNDVSNETRTSMPLSRDGHCTTRYLEQYLDEAVALHTNKRITRICQWTKIELEVRPSRPRER
jgi:hypothetical protein